eukprot:TRINITY_DN11745_c0_g1_i2.p2 TRINITY_DN11745_c0_g1~~TRINITY_DN11745_c0_g1_i2.p2  ORF type:complete len:319 (+),score=17.90 TRINITY_DN11745_c0_g1_i2:57-959(+)
MSSSQTQQQRQVVPSKLTSLVSGALSGAVVGAIVQPLDVVRTRLQADKAVGISRSLVGAVKACIKDGGVRALWSGTSATVLRLSMGAGMYFLALETVKTVLCPTNRNKMSATNAAMAGGVSRSFSTAILCPLTVIKTRMEYTAATYQFKYDSVVNAIQRIAVADGVGGLWRGLVPTILSSTPFSMLYLTFYTQLKQGFEVRGPVGNFTIGLVAGTCATLITQPMDVVRTRQQLGLVVGNGTIGIIKSILQNEGVVGLLVGTAPRVVKRTLQTALIWTIYEEVMPYVQKLFVKDESKSKLN